MPQAPQSLRFLLIVYANSPARWRALGRVAMCLTGWVQKSCRSDWYRSGALGYFHKNRLQPPYYLREQLLKTEQFQCRDCKAACSSCSTRPTCIGFHPAKAGLFGFMRDRFARTGMFAGKLAPVSRYDLIPSTGRCFQPPIATAHAGGSVQQDLSVTGRCLWFF